MSKHRNSRASEPVERTVAPAAERIGKKPYSSPRLVEYGDFHRLTRSASAAGDGGLEPASLGVPTDT